MFIFRQRIVKDLPVYESNETDNVVAGIIGKLLVHKSFGKIFISSSLWNGELCSPRT